MKREPFNLELDIREALQFCRAKQEQIALATRSGDIERANKYAHELVVSEQARVLAVHRIVTNAGHRSKGLSKEQLITNEDYQNMVDKLLFLVTNPKVYKSYPLDRIYIPKKNGKLRPISIPSYTDRSLQALYFMAIEPMAEEYMDKSSYGFRPIRNPQWAAGRCLNLLANPLAKYKFVIEIDIEGCFDNIDHDLLKSIVPFIPTTIVWEWLKSGYMERDNHDIYETTKGVPQGGIISPLLANMALDGLERFISEGIKKKYQNLSSGLVRYADDMVYFVTTYSRALLVLDLIISFLQTRGLNISEAKSRITNLDNESFEFVGYKFRRVYRRNRKRLTARICIPLSARRKFQTKIRSLKFRRMMLHTYIEDVNRIIMGWAGYYKHAHDSIYIFRSLRYWIWKQYYSKCYRLTSEIYDKANHTIKHEKVMKSYFQRHEEYSDWPVIVDKQSKIHTLVDISSYKFVNPVYTNLAQNPYIMEDLIFLERAQLKNRDKTIKAKVLEKSQGCCGLCGRKFSLSYTPIEYHHIKPRKYGGSNQPKNLIPLCKEPCHLLVTTALAKRDFNEIEKLVNLNILDLPDEFFELNHPTTISFLNEKGGAV